VRDAAWSAAQRRILINRSKEQGVLREHSNGLRIGRVEGDRRYQNQILTLAPLSLIVDYARRAEVFLIRKTAVKNTIFTYTFSYTLLSDTRKSLMANRDR